MKIGEARIRFSSARVRRALAPGIRAAIARTPLDAPDYPVSEAPWTDGTIAIVHVSRANVRRLAERVEALRPRVLGVQLVWDGVDPELLPGVFRALERARGTRGAPVMLSDEPTPSLALRLRIMRKEPTR